MSKLFRITLLLSVFFGVNKIVALIRQALIARQFGLSPAIDAFNVANNIPDLLFSLISGGALALAFIPVLTEYIDKKGTDASWVLFSRIANLVFLATAFLSVLVALFALPLISSPIGIAPGFTHQQQILTSHLMQLNLVATLIFSLSGLVMAALQSHKSFVLPAVAPILYNIGQIFGAVILTPIFNMGVYGLAWGVIIGAVLHLLIQVPGLFKYDFVWHASFGLADEGVRKVLRLLGPRILTVLFIQIIFLTRDNLASRLQEGAVSALTYGYFILQVPETLIGTAIATALLPTLSHFADEKMDEAFIRTLHTALRVLISLSVIISVALIAGMDGLVGFVFHFDTESRRLLTITAQAYLIGLVGQCLLEVVTRAYYARQDSRTPFILTMIRMILFVALSVGFYNRWGAVGLAFIDSVTVTLEVGILLLLLYPFAPSLFHLRGTVVRTAFASVGIVVLSFFLGHSVLSVILGMAFGLLIIWKDVKVALRI